MWLLHFFSNSLIEFIVHTILFLGVAICGLCFFAFDKVTKLYPPARLYQKMAQIAGVVFLVAGIYFEGGYAAEMQWRNRVKEVEAKLEVAKKESVDANSSLNKVKAQKVKVIREKAIVVKQYIDREVTKYDATCTIPPAVVKAHNAAAKNEDLK